MVGGIENEGESMPRTRKNHSPSLKAKVAIEAIKAQKTTTQISPNVRRSPTQVGGWKRQALAGLPDVFGTQARSGWRPSGRLLVGPLHHLRTPQILSKRWGPPQSFIRK